MGKEQISESGKLNLTEEEKMVLNTIKKEGKFVPPATGELRETLKNLMWMEYIERDKEYGIKMNVFIGGWFFVFLEQMDF
jgi:hypothetical protein